MEIDAPSEGMTAFVDILGFGARVAEAKTREEVVGIARAVEKIQNLFEFRDRQDWVTDLHGRAGKTVLAFSDSVVINVPLYSETTSFQGDFDTWVSEIHDLAMAQANCVLNGVFIRGGVDRGWWYRSEDILVSQSLARAYQMENNAVYPVIALTDDLFQFLKSHKDRETYHESIEPLSFLLKWCSLSSTRGESSGFWFINYLKVAAAAVGTGPRNAAEKSEYESASSVGKQEMRDDWYKDGLRDFLALHARKIEEAHSLATTPRVVSKYVWLSSYHNEFVRSYNVGLECMCRVRGDIN